jgi:uncharacterized membrane protein YqjE
MTTSTDRRTEAHRVSASPAGEPSIGELVGEATRELSELMRQEVRLAKVELREETATAAAAGVRLGGAALSAYLALLFASVALALGLAAFMPTWFAFLLVAVGYGVASGFLYLQGRERMKSVEALPKTRETLKEDAEWARAQTG